MSENERELMKALHDIENTRNIGTECCAMIVPYVKTDPLGKLRTIEEHIRLEEYKRQKELLDKNKTNTSPYIDKKSKTKLKKLFGL